MSRCRIHCNPLHGQRVLSSQLCMVSTVTHTCNRRLEPLPRALHVDTILALDTSSIVDNSWLLCNRCAAGLLLRLEPGGHRRACVLLGLRSALLQVPRAGRVLSAQPLHHRQAPRYRSCSAHHIVPQTGRVLCPEPLQHFKISIAGRFHSRRHVPRARRVLRPHPLQYIQVTVPRSICAH